jgi:hypothetical protein
MLIGDRCRSVGIIYVDPAHHRLIFPTGRFGPLRGIALLRADGMQRHVPFLASWVLGFPRQSQYFVWCLMPFGKIWS